MKLLLTGATGFIGGHLYHSLTNATNQKYDVTTVLRTKNKLFLNALIISNFGKSFKFRENCANTDVVVHCAARVHILNETSTDPLESFRNVNTHVTLNLAQQAADAGVKRFIFISSIKVNGESTELSKPFTSGDNYVPTDPFSLSKYEAEVGLREIAAETGMEIVIIRPPLVYGPGVKANFAAMMKWVNKGIPLPLGGIKSNKRSLVSVDNLVDLIITCIDHPKAVNQTFLVSDDEDVSTTGLLKNMATALNVPSRLIPIPAAWFTIASKLIGKPVIAQRLCGSLQVDISKTKALLGWKPPYSSAECMKKTADAWILKRKVET